MNTPLIAKCNRHFSNKIVVDTLVDFINSVEYSPESSDGQAIRRAIYMITTRKITQIFRAGRRYRQTRAQADAFAYVTELYKLIDLNNRKAVNPTKVHAQIGININHQINFAGLDSITELLSEKFGAIIGSLDWKTLLVSSGLCLSNIWYNWDRPATIMMAVGQFLTTLNLGSQLFAEVSEFLTSLYHKSCAAIETIYGQIKSKLSNRLRAQMSFPIDLSPIIPIIGGLLSTLFSVIVMKNLPGGDKFDTTFNRFSRISGVVKSLTDITSIGNQMFTTFWDSISLNLFGVERPQMDEWKNINAWIDEVHTLIVPGFEQSMRNNEMKKNQVESLIKRGLNINRFVDAIKVPMVERQSITSCLLFLNKAREVAGNCGAGQTKPRVAPAIIHFYGDSGVGKSTTLWSLLAELQASLGVTKASDLHEKTYFRRPGAKFWDGYDTGMNIVVCDDFGAIRDSVAAPNEEFLEAIHMSNTAFWQLNMAELSEKRNTFFNAKCVLWTSNRSHFSVESLTNPEAVLRRVDLKIRQYPHPNFAKTDVQAGKTVQILDNILVNEAIKVHGSSAMLGCVLFDIIDKTCPNDTPIQEGLDFWQIAKICVDKMQSTISRFEDFHKVLDDHVADAINRCASGEWESPTTTSEFNPNTFVSKLRAQGLFSDACAYAEKISEYTTLGYRHCKVDGEGEVFPVYLGIMSDEDRERLSDLCDFDCFNLMPRDHQSFLNCWASAESAWFYLEEVNQTDEAFINLFCQAEKHFQYTMSVWGCQSCKSSRIERIGKLVKSGAARSAAWIERRFAMSPTKFIALAAVATTVFGLCSYLIYNKIFARVQTLVPEGYVTDVTRKAASKRFAETYSTDVTRRKNVPRVENYATDVTKNLKRNHVETYSTDVTLRKTTPRVENLQSQAIVDKNAAEVVSSVYRNMYKLEYFEDDEWHHSMNLIVVKGRLAIVNRHLMVYADKSLWRIRNQAFSDGIEFQLSKCPCFFAPDSDTKYGMRDIMMIELPSVVHQHKDISSKFMDSDEYSMFRHLAQVSVIGYIPGSEIAVRQYFGSDCQADDSTFTLTDSADNDLVSVRTLIKYNIQTTGGDCGAIVVAFDKHFDNKIIGVHCAGINDARFQGFATPVSRSMIRHLEKNINLEHPSSLMSPSVECTENLKLHVTEGETSRVWKYVSAIVGNFYPIGVTSQAVFQSTESKIKPSPVYGMIQEPTMAPAVLKTIRVDGKIIDPMANARVKASPISKPINDDILKECSYEFLQKIDTSDVDKFVLTHEQAITGIPGDVCYPPMKRNTSPGYGWEKVGKGKTQYLGSSEYVTDHPKVLEACDRIRDQISRGERPNTIWTDTLKDERRTLDKVAAGKTRLFSCGEMAYTIVFRQYFAGFIAHMTRNKIDVESCVGTNVYSYDWNKIAQKLKQVGNKMLAGDFANYDGTLHPGILWEVLDLINAWYNDGSENALRRTALWSEIVNSIHIVGNTFYMWNHSQPSGCPMTTILNCTYHSLSARYVYLVCAQRYMPSMQSLVHFEELVRHVNYGDDDLWCIADSIIEWFNQVTITEAYKVLGMTYTDEAKTGVIVPFRSLSEINFLKREFRWDPVQARYRAPLALATILEMAMWVHGDLDTYENCAAIMQDAVRELAQHDESVFNANIGKFKEAQKVVNKVSPCIFKTYRQYQFEEAVKLLE